MNYLHLTQTLSESFVALADEVQSLIDRKTILEHKLRYAHEQFQYLADKYAPAVPEVSEALAKLQLPPDIQYPVAAASSVVPLPKRTQLGTSQHQVALLIREGRKAAQHLFAKMDDLSKGSGSSKEMSDSPGPETMTSQSTVLEQDFTVEGKKGDLACPFSKKSDEVANDIVPGVDAEVSNNDAQNLTDTTVDPTPHKSSDPICAAMLEETTPAAAHAPGAAKCPIRFLDKHSPEEIAHYVEKHKHEIPRSHEVCVRRYQKNEEQIKKLDAKYGNLVSMINDLSHLHQPMLPSAAGGGEEDPEDLDRASNKRVENWAQTVSANDPEQQQDENEMLPVEKDRESHFDRPLRDVRVGESPSRPWGISVPLMAPSGQPGDDVQRPESPPPAPPVSMPSLLQTPKEGPMTWARKCPFDHTKLAFTTPFSKPHPDLETTNRRAEARQDAEVERPYTPVKNRVPPSRPPPPSTAPPRPTFINPSEMHMPNHTEKGDNNGYHQPPPQMVFNISGPVFIGYPMEQAIQFMQHYQGQ
ncbi:hypothetical protein QBC46DRAFT_382520 [Diplogelasinospora grovesii]|uniref:Uncharacterized protein n=1 Tax=Diplogelasinospora grovesii TaxID=303347 RepID=A0AAN6S5U5_9PEZI|nr:hypothetical protein QBC46DRAFT_382520 [Diplogelasinospora grovesii]